MSESLCGICGISAERVITRTAAGIVAVPGDTARDGHVMVVSAKHARSFADLLVPEADALMALVASATRAAEKASGVEKCYVLRIGDKHPHLHFHIVPAAEADPALGPYVFGDHGWRAGVASDALPASAVFEPAFREGVAGLADMTPRNPGRLPAWLVSLSITLLAFAVALAVAWSTIGPPLASPLALFVGFVTMQALDDRMRGVPVRWINALVGSAVAAAVLYFMQAWLLR